MGDAMSGTTSTGSTTETVEQHGGALGWFHRHTELVIAILLGIASIVTAYASFQSSLFDGEVNRLNTKAGVLAAEAESFYLEGNQQYVSDAQLFDRVTELSIIADGPDPAAAAIAQETIDVLLFRSATEAFSAAMDWAVVENEADPTMFTHPQLSEDYLATLFGGYEETKALADAALADAAFVGDLGDRLTLNTVLLAISLFLLGVAAILRTRSVRVLLAGVATTILVVATVLTIVVVSTPIA
jgi:hypothetical protein